MSFQLARKQVVSHANTVNRGVIDTPLIYRGDEPRAEQLQTEVLPQLLKRYGKPEEIAALIAYLLGDESKFTTCSAYSIDGGWSS